MSVKMCPRCEAGDHAMCEAMADCRTQIDDRRYVNTLVDALHDASVRCEDFAHDLAAEQGGPRRWSGCSTNRRSTSARRG